jgi:alkylation response protein AidB-like acyl-CoA dehydrogenase
MQHAKPTDDLALSALLNPRHPIKVEVADWARAELDPGDLVDRDRTLTFFRRGWEACARKGILGSAVASEFGGAGDDLVTTLLKLEGLGLGCRDNGFGFAVASQVLSFQGVITRSGSEAQRGRILPAACAGERIGAVAMTEEISGSDTFALATRATPTEDGWALDGTKRYITLAPVADEVVVFAVTDPDAGTWGLSAFLVPTDRPGITCTPSQGMMGLRTSAVGDVELEACPVTEADLIGPVGAGAGIFQASMAGERALILATHLGAAERQIEAAVARSRTRVQFGEPIGAFQAVSHRLADMRSRLDAARLLVYRAAIVLARGGHAAMESAVAHAVGQEAVAEIALGAARVHGARGYMTEFEVEREVRDALGATVHAGTSDLQKNLIAALMGVGRAGSIPP